MPTDAPAPETPPTLPELLEADASPQIRAIYAGLRRGAVTPIAALIWRHIATHAGMLEACWASLAPLFADGRIQQAAWDVARQETPRRLLPPVAFAARPALGINAEDGAAILALAEAYNRANPVNLLGVKILLARLESAAPGEPAPSAAPWLPPSEIGRAIPAMTAPADLDPAIRTLLNDLRFGDTGTIDPVVPSLYRHLTDWPAYLAVLHIGLSPLFKDGTMQRATDKVVGAMDAHAARLARQIDPVPVLAAEPALQATMRRFAGGVIPTMIVVGRAIADQMSRPDKRISEVVTR